MHNVQHETDSLDSAILDYLHEFGNTREADLIKALKTDFAERTIKNHLKTLEKDEKIHPIYHTKLRPIAVYYSLREQHIPLELQKELIRARAQVHAAELRAYAGGEAR